MRELERTFRRSHLLEEPRNVQVCKVIILRYAGEQPRRAHVVIGSHVWTHLGAPVIPSKKVCMHAAPKPFFQFFFVMSQTVAGVSRLGDSLRRISLGQRVNLDEPEMETAGLSTRCIPADTRDHNRLLPEAATVGDDAGENVVVDQQQRRVGP